MAKTKFFPRLLPFEKTFPDSALCCIVIQPLGLETAVNRSSAGVVLKCSPVWPQLESQRWRFLWVELVVSARPCYESYFNGYSGFSLSLNTSISKYNSIRTERWSTAMWVQCGTSKWVLYTSLLVNPLRPKRDQHQLSAVNIHIESREKIMIINKIK